MTQEHPNPDDDYVKSQGVTVADITDELVEGEPYLHDPWTMDE